MKIIVSGGGTGGHIYPALTLIDSIKRKQPNTEFLYVGTEAGLEADIVPKTGINFTALNLEGGFERHFTLENFTRAFNAIMSVKEAADIVKQFKPNAVVGTGGYVCGPILLAAALKKVPTLIQEQNAVAGITNKILSAFVDKIAVGTRDALKNFPKDKTVYTGNPIRAEVLAAKKVDGLKEFNFSADKPIVLISGGSRGARSINDAMVDVLKIAAEKKSAQFLHVTGKLDFDSVIEKIRAAGVNLDTTDNIKVVPYLYNMPTAMAMADLAIFRAGATGLAELTARGIPAILIPYPYAAENHQEFNARSLVEVGAARMILNKDLTAETLSATLDELLSSPDTLKEMAKASLSLGKPNAADDIADLILNLTTEINDRS
ncbi:MAG: undecaprenyldiphospho-muramoylpentapeptide beta-N-acetylglucosaminyltransferase [Selenomonadaceae bacterium]|nr:undecaprenyldiphospho-muramoylpentapeptide beta-N-acetylglucosaminyltransferase [Selenomonadaceae bacterium]